MIQHVFSLLSAPAFLAGVVCLALGLGHADRALRPALPCPSPPAGLFRRAMGTVCALCCFLLLPTGSFPAYIPGTVAVPAWLALFVAACSALGQPPQMPAGVNPDKAFSKTARTNLSLIQIVQIFRRAWSVLGTPVVLGVVFAVCARFARLHGFPGNIWRMEVYVALPLYTGADALQLTGFACLAVATVLQGAALPVCGKAPVLSSCVRLAAAQFTVCLFFPVLPSRLWALPAVPAVVLDAVLHFGLVVGLYLVFIILQRAHSLSVAALLAIGAGLCL